MTSIKDALEPCPFCNGAAESDSQQHYRNITTGNLEKAAAVYCTACEAHMTWCYRDTPEIEREQVMELLVERWNTRATLTTPAPGREELRERIAGIKADPGDGTVVPDLAHVLARGFHAMGWGLPQHAAEDIIRTILSALPVAPVIDEAAIRADEREKCARIAESGDHGIGILASGIVAQAIRAGGGER